MRGPLAALAVIVALVAAAPAGAAPPPSDAWIEGYAAAVLERELALPAPSVRVRDGVLTLRVGELSDADRARVEALLRTIRGVTRVEILAAPPPAAVSPVATAVSPVAAPAATPAAPPTVLADWPTGLLPGGTLFKPLIADPRWPHFAASYQQYLRDPTLKDVGAVSFGETFSLLRERYWQSWWEVGVQAGVFAIFDLDAFSKDLINADYFVALPFSYRTGDFSALLRVFHQSSHLGDEFILRTNPQRLNLSYEGVDAKLSYEFQDWLRVYGGAGYIFDTDPPDLHPWSIQYGAEVASPWPDRAAGWRPIAAVDVQHREENDWSSDFSARAGIEIDGVLASRKMQLLFEYFLGRSPNGQFFKQKIEYFGVGLHFHF
jgi:hypothetical protein